MIACWFCKSTDQVIPNRHRMLCLKCSTAEIERDGITFTEIDQYGREYLIRTVDPDTGLRYCWPRAWQYR